MKVFLAILLFTLCLYSQEISRPKIDLQPSTVDLYVKLGILDVQLDKAKKQLQDMDNYITLLEGKLKSCGGK